MFWNKKKTTNSDQEGEQNAQGPLYSLELVIEGIDSQTIPIEGELLIGNSESAHISIEGVGLSEEQATIRLQNHVLTLTNHADEGTYIGDQRLQKGKSYIIDGGDVLTLGAAKILIKKEGQIEAPLEDHLSPPQEENDQESKSEAEALPSPSQLL